MPRPYSLWPAFKCGDSVESEHGIQHIIKVKVTVDPLPLTKFYVLKRILHMMHITSPDNNKDKNNPCYQTNNHNRPLSVMSSSLKNYNNMHLLKKSEQ